jgi:phosphatidylserine decarboxylase
MHPIVERLARLVEKNGWQKAFNSALNGVAEQNVTALARVKTLDDYLHYIDDMVHWAPRESGDSLLVHDKLVEFYFVLDQRALRSLQSPNLPGTSDQPLTPLSEWIVDFAKAWGSYLDLPDSAKHIDSFRKNPEFRWDDYMPPPSGYLTFNQFFARHAKPGRRPVANLEDPSVVVSPADATFNGQWLIAADSTIAGEAKELSVKGLRWSYSPT